MNISDNLEQKLKGRMGKWGMGVNNEQEAVAGGSQ
jgi:hypothetical protein